MCLELAVCVPDRGVGFISSVPNCCLMVCNSFNVQVTVHRDKFL